MNSTIGFIGRINSALQGNLLRIEFIRSPIIKTPKAGFS
jgi:hypothetical protein